MVANTTCRALAGVLECRVAGIVDKIGVVAEPADHEVGGRTTVEQIVAGVAVDHVHETVAVALQVGAALQHQGLDVRRQPVVDGCEHRVVALAGILDHDVAGIIDEVGVVTDATAHGVGAAATVDEVVAAVAEDRVDEAVAEALQVGAALQHQGLDVRRQPVVDGGEDRVVALAGALDHHIAGIVDEVGVVAGAAAHGIAARAAVEQIVAAVAEDRVDQRVAVALQVGNALQHQSSPRSPSARS